MSVSEIPEFREGFRTALPGSVRRCGRETQLSHLHLPIHRPRPEEILDLQPSRLRPLEDRPLDLRGELPRAAWGFASLLLPGRGMKPTIRVSGHYGVDEDPGIDRSLGPLRNPARGAPKRSRFVMNRSQ